MMKNIKFFVLFFVSGLLLASCDDEDKTQSGNFGTIQVPDVAQLAQMAEAGEGASNVTFTTEAAWSATIRETRAEAPDWITISPDHGDQAGSYTVQITLQPNTGQESRTAFITITCESSEIEISVTQKASDESSDEEGDGSQERRPNGRLVHITEYENGTADYFLEFDYDDMNRLISIHSYFDAEQTAIVNSWEFQYESPSRIVITEKYYDPDGESPRGNTWICEGNGFDSPEDGGSITRAEVTDLVDPTSRKIHTYTYGEDGLTANYVEYFLGDENWLGETQYTYQNGNCTQIQWSEGGKQTITYDSNIHKHTAEYERLFQEYSAINPGLFFTYDSDMLRSLGMLGITGDLLPVKVVTHYANPDATPITETLTYNYYDLDDWKIGERRDGMEIILQNNSGAEYRYVLTFEGI